MQYMRDCAAQVRRKCFFLSQAGGGYDAIEPHIPASAAQRMDLRPVDGKR